MQPKAGPVRRVRPVCVTSSREPSEMARAGGSASDGGTLDQAPDLLWVLPRLTCGYSPNQRPFRVVREF